MIMKSDIKKLVRILFVHLSSISLENFRDRAFIIPEILELIKLNTYKFGLVYIVLFSPLSKSESFRKDTSKAKSQFHGHHSYSVSKRFPYAVSS